MKDLSGLVSLTGLPFSAFEDALHYPEGTICPATTATEARTMYYDAHKGSNNRKAALGKWIDLCTTIEEIREATGQTLLGSDDERSALSKWTSMCDTLEEALEAYSRAHPQSAEERMILRKMVDLYERG